MMGALGVPAAFGAMLVFGLTVVVPLVEPEDTLTGFNIEPIPETDPEPPVQPVEATNAQTPPPQPVQPSGPNMVETPFDFGSSPPIGVLPMPEGDLLGPIAPIEWGPPAGRPGLEPIAASPRGNPGNWVTDRDYRSRWVREEMSGTAAFELQIDAKGQVSDCTITRSSGHSALDTATCKLITKRGRFNPATDSAGNAVPGSYTNAINWVLPD